MKTIYIDGSVLSRQIASGISNYLVNISNHFNNNIEGYGMEIRTGFLRQLPINNVFFRQLHLGQNDYEIVSNADFFKRITFGSNLKFDLYHSPYMFLPPRTSNHINLLTVHDLIYIRNAPGLKDKIRKQLLRSTIKRADFFVCVSHNTRAELLELFPAIENDNVFVIHQGIDSIFMRDEPASLREPKSPYLLYVGQRGGYKNFHATINFFSTWKYRQSFRLVCVGGGSFTREEIKMFQMLKISDSVCHLGYVDSDELKLTYANAQALMYTSNEEGFGLPILEAMACGCPVITGNFSSMKEVGGAHAILLNDYSAESITDGVEKSFQLSETQLSQARQYARSFTWAKTGHNTLNLYNKLLRNYYS